MTIDNFKKFIDNAQSSNAYEIKSFELGDNYLGKHLIEVETDGYQGGNCWNDNEPEPYYKSSTQIISSIAEQIQNHYSYFLKELAMNSNLVDTSYRVADNLIEIADRHVGEYYGNSTHYKLYEVDMRDIFSATLDADAYALFEKALLNAKMIDNPDMDDILAYRDDLSAQLDRFDSEKSRDKDAIAFQLEKLQKVYDDFDKHRDCIKENLTVQLKEVEGMLRKKPRI